MVEDPTPTPEEIEQHFRVNLNNVKDQIIWDFDVRNEFKNQERPRGYAFVIDVIDNSAQLCVYKVSAFVSQTSPIAKQPPLELMERAVKEQGGSLESNNLFNINGEVKKWIQTNLL